MKRSLVLLVLGVLGLAWASGFPLASPSKISWACTTNSGTQPNSQCVEGWADGGGQGPACESGSYTCNWGAVCEMNWFRCSNDL